MLAILTTHPIQYQVPLWQKLAKEGTIPFEVWYLTDHGAKMSFDQQFGKSFSWDINILEGYPYRFISVNKAPNVNSFWKLRLDEPLKYLFQSQKVTALWIQGWQCLAYWQAAWQAQQAGIPVWVRGESNDLKPPHSSDIWKKPFKKIVLGNFFSKIDYFLYVGQANRRLYKNYGIEDRQFYPAPYCIDNARFAQQADAVRSQRNEFRKQWNIPEDAFCLLFAGKFIPIKRPEQIIMATRLLNNTTNCRPIHLLFVGSGELGNKLRSACHVVYDAEGNLTSVTDFSLPKASFAGFLNQTQISSAYVASDCLVLPSVETWGLVVNEAMASGIPSIASNTCGCTEDLITPINSELCFKLDDVEDLARAINKVASLSAATLGLSQQVAKYDLNVTIDSIHKIYPKQHLLTNNT